MSTLFTFGSGSVLLFVIWLLLRDWFSFLWVTVYRSRTTLCIPSERSQVARILANYMFI